MEVDSFVEEEALDRADSQEENAEAQNARDEHAQNEADWCYQPVYDRYWKHKQKVDQWFRKLPQPNHCSQQVQYPGIYGANPNMTQYYYQAMLHWQQRYYQLLSEAKSPHDNSRLTRERDRSFSERSRASSAARRSSHGNKRSQKGKNSKSNQKSKQARLDISAENTMISSVSSCTHGDFILDVDKQLFTAEHEVLECHMQITDEMVDFFAQSAIHRKQRDEEKKQKREEEKKAENAIIDISKAGKGSANATTAAPMERPGQKRTAEMKQLYGTGAAMIHGMETAMQLNYCRILDRQQPKHWPHLPINILFNK